MASGDDPRAADQWERLRGWLQRKIAQMAEGDFERLPSQFSDDDGRRASEAYETVLLAMEVLEGRRGTAARRPDDAT
ncbi:MAG: hypothetical protein OXG43_12310 [Chloroflexi bacterium]|nr:hypothetical protein [Chloroflexota bacterium]